MDMSRENVGGNINTNLNLAYDEYAKNDEIKIVETRTDYAVLMRETLTQLQDGIDMLEATVMAVPNLKNLVRVAQDYLFYLEDNRRVIL